MPARSTCWSSSIGADSSTLELAVRCTRSYRTPILLATGSYEEIDANALVAAGVSISCAAGQCGGHAVGAGALFGRQGLDAPRAWGWMRATMSALHRKMTRTAAGRRSALPKSTRASVSGKPLL